jgi:signal transduction histidine kinase
MNGLRQGEGEAPALPARFLVVDDHQDMATSLRELLVCVEEGAQASIAADARAAFDRVTHEGEHYDVALLDLHLPDAFGTELLTQLRSTSPALQIVIVTGDSTLESAMQAVRAGAFAYVIKPIVPKELIDTVRRALVQARALRESEQLRHELEQSERRHREVVEKMPAFVLALDTLGRIVLWNSHLEQVTGYSREEMLSRDGTHLVGEDGSDRRLPIKSGGHRLVRWQRTSVSVGEDSGLVYAMGTDVTDEREMLRRTLRAERLAAVGTLAAGLAHEVRNPLNSAQLQLDLLERRLARGPLSAESILSTSRILRDELRRLDRLVSDFLAFAQPRPLDLKVVVANELVGGVVEFISPEVAERGITLSAQFDADSGSIHVEPQRFRQVLINLLRNAVEAMQSGGTLGISTHGPDEAGNVVIEVRDTGPGFSEDAPIFDAFYTTKEGGTGLGLSIVYRIVSDHGGTIQCSSVPGDTRFSVLIPQVPATPSSPAT